MKQPLSINRMSLARQFDRRWGRLKSNIPPNGPAYPNYPADFLLREIERRMLERLDCVRLSPTQVVDLGCGQGQGAALLQQRFPTSTVTGLDLSPQAIALARRNAESSGRQEQSNQIGLSRSFVKRMTNLFSKPEPAKTAPTAPSKVPLYFIQDFHRTEESFGNDSGDQVLAPTELIDLLWSNLALHWSDEPIDLLKNWRRRVKPGGLVMFSTFGPDSFKELAALGVDLPVFQDLHDWGDALHRAKFLEPVMDAERITLTYQTPDNLLKDLSGFGGNALSNRSRGLKGRSFLNELNQQLKASLPLNLTIEIVYGQAWASDKPLAPEGYAPIEYRPRPKRA